MSGELVSAEYRLPEEVCGWVSLQANRCGCSAEQIIELLVNAAQVETVVSFDRDGSQVELRDGSEIVGWLPVDEANEELRRVWCRREGVDTE